MEKPIPGLGLNLRRGGAKLRSLGKAHRPLHILLWQAHEVQSTLLQSASAQNILFTDIANWASSENRALSDVCSTTSELFNLYSSAQLQLAIAFKSFRKDMAIILEGEKRCDVSQKKLQEAESKRLKLRRHLLRLQNRNQVNNGENTRQVCTGSGGGGGAGGSSGDFTSIQTQLAEAERNAERCHLEACEVAKEQESVKLVILRTALIKLSQAQLLYGNQIKTIFNGTNQLANEIPEPPAPGDHLSCIRYNGFNTTRAIVTHVKRNVQRTISAASNRSVNGGHCSEGGGGHDSPTAAVVEDQQVFIIDNHSLAITPTGVGRGGGGPGNNNRMSAGNRFLTSTPITSPNNADGYANNNTLYQNTTPNSAAAGSQSWAQLQQVEPSAPNLSSGSLSGSTNNEPPPPYNTNYKSPNASRRSRNSSTASSSTSSHASRVTTRRRYQNMSSSSIAPIMTPPNSANSNTSSQNHQRTNSSSPSAPYYSNVHDNNNIIEDRYNTNSTPYYYGPENETVNGTNTNISISSSNGGSGRRRRY